MAKGGEEDARTIWIFFCFFLRSRPAGGDGFGKGSTLGHLLRGTIADIVGILTERYVL